MAYEKERRIGITAVRLASSLCQKVQKRLVSDATLTKGDRSPVTVADFGAQAIISHLLEQRFADDPLVGEEDAQALREDNNAGLKEKVTTAVQELLPDLDEAAILASIDRGVYPGGATGRHWVLDPIDGTKGFLRIEQYAIALGLIQDGEVVLGVLGCPNLPHPNGTKGCLFVAVKGEGAYMQSLSEDSAESRIFVSTTTNSSRARFCESVEKAHSSHSNAAQIALQLGITKPPFRIDSQCKYAAVARGDASIYLRLPTRKDYVEKIWDHAAGWRIIIEAGGQVTDVRGQPLDFSLGRGLSNNSGVIVTNGLIHDQVIKAVKSVLKLN